MFADLLISRTRTILWVVLLTGLAFTALEVALAPRLAAPFVVKGVGVSLTTAGLVLLRRPWAMRHAMLASLAVILVAYLLTAVSGMVSPSREYATTAVLFVGGALATATLLPWGVWPQTASVLFGVALLGAAVFREDGNLQVVADDPGAAVAIGLALSLVTAREMQRYRLASVRELAARRQADREVRALNVDLERRVAERTAALAAANAQLRTLSARLESVREEERTRIAREVHDDLGQMLTALKIDLDVLPRRIAADELLRQRLAAMSELANTMINSVRRICAELRPSLLDELGLAAAIEWQVQEFQRHRDVRCTFTCEPGEVTLDPIRSTALFRISQEALTNVARHAKATRIAVALRGQDGHLVLEVCDNGRGITETELHSPQSLGLLGIRERARLVGGEVDIRGAAGRGTTVRVCIPQGDPGPPSPR